MARPALPRDIQAMVARALAEDVGDGDVTADLVPVDQRATATVISREDAVLCGTAWFDEVYRQLDAAIEVQWSAGDGDRIAAGQALCRLAGRARPLLTGERTSLNFLQTLSGTATAARRYADAVAGSGCKVLDTRKTLPGLRAEQKYATACGGVANHRRGLYDAILIKENHIIAAGGIGAALSRARAAHPELTVEIEVETLQELEAALAGGADIVLVDNFDLATLAEAVRINGGRARLEASGNVALDRLAEIAATGVDYVSVGAVTKHLQAVDLSLRFRFEDHGR